MTKALTIKQKNDVLVSNFEEDSKAGFENADKDAYSIPFLTILQDLSPQVKKRNAAYVKGAAPGMILNTVTESVADGSKGILIIPVSYNRNFIEWVPRPKGGFVAAHDTEPEGGEWVEESGGGSKYMLPSGNELNDTRNHFVIIAGDLSPGLLSMARTQVKNSKKWMSQMQALKFEGKGKKLYTPPMFASVYKATTAVEQKDQNEWFGWKFERVRDVNLDEYNAAKGFLEAVQTERAVTDYSSLDDEPAAAAKKATGKNDDMPF